MASVKKYTNAAAAQIFTHNERTAKAHKNEQIDRSKSKGNYRLFAPRKGSAGNEISDREYYKQRLEQLKVWNRKDVKTACEWIITLPASVSDADEKEFFQESLNFLADRYGGAVNICSAIVHKDETTPHLHCIFIPTPDSVRVSAKDCVHRADLKTFHSDLKKHMAAAGIKGATDVFTGITKKQGGNRTVQQLKAQGERERGKFRLQEREPQKGVFINYDR